MTAIGLLLLTVGAIGTVGSIAFGAVFVGQWSMALAVGFVMIGTLGVILGKPRR